MTRQQQTYALPTVPPGADTLTRHFLMQFMHEFQRARAGDARIRILHAIEGTARKSGSTPEAVARALVESGLRAERDSFPGKFIDAVEGNAHAPKWNPRAITPQQRELLDFWGACRAPANGYKRARRYH